MEIFVGMLSGLALGVIGSYMRILLSFKTFCVIFLGVLVPITAGVLWLVAILIADFVYQVPTINVWRTLLLANAIFFAVGTFVMNRFWREMAEQMQKQKEENETSIQ